jgi:hypothetical protein
MCFAFRTHRVIIWFQMLLSRRVQVSSVYLTQVVYILENTPLLRERRGSAAEFWGMREERLNGKWKI